MNKRNTLIGLLFIIILIAIYSIYPTTPNTTEVINSTSTGNTTLTNPTKNTSSGKDIIPNPLSHTQQISITKELPTDFTISIDSIPCPLLHEKYICFSSKINTSVNIEISDNNSSYTHYISSPTHKLENIDDLHITLLDISPIQNLTINIKTGSDIIAQKIVELYGGINKPLLKSINITNDTYKFSQNINFEDKEIIIQTLPGLNSLTFDTYTDSEISIISNDLSFSTTGSSLYTQIEEHNHIYHFEIEVKNNLGQTSQYSLKLIPSYFLVLSKNQSELPPATKDTLYQTSIKVYTKETGKISWNITSPLPDNYITEQLSDDTLIIKSDKPTASNFIFSLALTTTDGRLLGSGPISFSIDLLENIKVESKKFHIKNQPLYLFNKGTELTLIQYKDNLPIGKYGDSIQDCSKGLCKTIIDKQIRDYTFTNYPLSDNTKTYLEIYIPNTGNYRFDLYQSGNYIIE